MRLAKTPTASPVHLRVPLSATFARIISCCMRTDAAIQYVLRQGLSSAMRLSSAKTLSARSPIAPSVM